MSNPNVNFKALIKNIKKSTQFYIKKYANNVAYFTNNEFLVKLTYFELDELLLALNIAPMDSATIKIENKKAIIVRNDAMDIESIMLDTLEFTGVLYENMRLDNTDRDFPIRYFSNGKDILAFKMHYLEIFNCPKYVEITGGMAIIKNNDTLIGIIAPFITELPNALKELLELRNKYY